MINKIKNNLLTYLFTDWVRKETDLETLALTRSMINRRENILIEDENTDRVIVKGFKRYR
tara:strand:- start:339 stop:518 length:180 start_codon:yes stop_codon:yes gene_type:complete